MKYGIFRDSKSNSVKGTIVIMDDSTPEKDGCYLQIVSKEDLKAAEVPTVKEYNADALISWAMKQIFTADLIPHFAAFLDFARNVSAVSTANFVLYANAVGQKEIAEVILAKAIELGAKVNA